MEEEDKIRYETLFFCQKLEDGFLSGDVARALFIRSKLPLPDLTKIWKLSDISHDNKLDVFEFSIAMHLIELKLCEQEIPKQLDLSVLPDHVKDVIIPVMTEPEKNLLKKVFEQKDRRSQGYLERDVVQPLLLASGLSPSLLTKIWNIADLDRDGRLSFLEFAIALHLVKNCINGVNLDGPVNPFICIPEEEGAIISCKEKLKIFDKEFLLEQKENEKETFSNFCELNDLDLDLLAEYLPEYLPEYLALNKGKRETDHVDNTSYQNALHAQRQEKEFDRMDISSKVKSCVKPSDNIECHRLTGNELEIDLDAIFQAVEVGNENNFNEVPKYFARSAQSEMAFSAVADDMEEDDDDDALPVTQKRTYIGKQLIFEDPIGSEIIGDVEFEVDFDAIVKDIERESVDEERRLPIARVLPIYKSLPVANEQPFEKKAASKDIREIDLDFNMNESITGLEKKGRDDSSDFDRTTILNSIIGSITNESQHAGAQEKLNIISSKESQDYNYKMLTNNSKKVNGTQNSYNSHEKDIPIDIVEEKRLMQRQMEERKKLHEKERNNRENIISSESLEPNSVGNTRIKGSKETIVLNVGSKTSNQELNEPSAKEEKKEKIGKAEEKERLLLGRIKYLERKREMLLEKKQQELKSKNTERENFVLTNKQGIQKESKGERMVTVMSDTYMLNGNPIDSWSQNSGQNVKTSSNSLSNEEEKKRLALALETKRRSEAELEKRRQAELREAEKRRLEQEAREEKERQSAKERKRNFMENLTKLKERVITEEATRSGMSDPKKHRSLKADGSLKENISDKQKLTSNSQDYADTQLSEKRHGIMKEMDKNNTSLNQLKKHGKDEIQKLQTNGSNTPSSPKKNNEKNEENEQLVEIRRENFKSNRELFMKKVESEKEANTEISKREKKNKARPKSFYGGMFNRSVHQIIDDDVLARDASVFEEVTLLEPDLVDKEALAQYHREKEFMKEHERVSKHQRSLNRDTSYTKENVEKLWTTETDNLLQNYPKECSQQKEKPLSNTNRRSLVNTLTTEWNSFLDILEGDDRRESETVKKRQEISAQRKTSTTGREKNAEIKHELAKDAKNEIVECHVSSTKSEQSEVESDLEILARQSGNVKKMVNTFKRLSLSNLLQQDVLQSPCTQPEKSEEHIQDESHDLHQTKQLLKERTVRNKTMTHARSEEDEPLKNDDVIEIKRQQQKIIIKDNAPKRKFDMAHLWTDVVSNQ